MMHCQEMTMASVRSASLVVALDCGISKELCKYFVFLFLNSIIHVQVFPYYFYQSWDVNVVIYYR
jgi:hypothetical protein